MSLEFGTEANVTPKLMTSKSGSFSPFLSQCNVLSIDYVPATPLSISEPQREGSKFQSQQLYKQVGGKGKSREKRGKE